MNPEEIPFIQLEMDDDTFIATPENAELFTFAPWAVLGDGELVLNPQSRNHVFLKTGDFDGEVQRGTFVMAPEIVQKLGAVMLQYGFPARLNQTRITESDEQAYQRYIDQNLEESEDFVPDDWIEDGKA